jgi:hypothetical protein
MYVEDQGVPHDDLTAYMWFNLAVPTRMPKTFTAVEARDSVAAKMTLDQIFEAQWLAREWAPK